jgi:hypothetical protein
MAYRTSYSPPHQIRLSFHRLWMSLIWLHTSPGLLDIVMQVAVVHREGTHHRAEELVKNA